MYQICRHIKSDNTRCGSPAVHGSLLCYHHCQQKKLTVRPKRHGSIAIPFVFPEDRAAVQLNLHLIALATLEGRIDSKTSHALTSTYRACIANLKAGPLVESDHKNAIHRVILTADGEEITTPREVLEPDEILAHGPECPCGVCAETYRNAPIELHHLDCKCGLCDDTTPGNRPSPPSDQNATPGAPSLAGAQRSTTLGEIDFPQTAPSPDRPTLNPDAPPASGTYPTHPIQYLQQHVADQHRGVSTQ